MVEEGVHEVRDRNSEEESETGPNDVRHFLWAIGEFFFFFFFNFFVFLYTNKSFIVFIVT